MKYHHSASHTSVMAKQGIRENVYPINGCHGALSREETDMFGKLKGAFQQGIEDAVFGGSVTESIGMVWKRTRPSSTDVSSNQNNARHVCKIQHTANLMKEHTCLQRHVMAAK